jgi:DNA-binding XRE family transcriptional regulator
MPLIIARRRGVKMAEKISGMYTLCAIADGVEAEPCSGPAAGEAPLSGVRRRRRRRSWHLSPDGFRELRHSCFLSRKACAEFLGVSERTVRHWDVGRCRVPWSAVRLLRLFRLGDLGALHESWDGWVLNRNGLWSPDGKRYSESSMRCWWLTSEQARFWRQDYDRRAAGGVGASAPAMTLQLEAGEAVTSHEVVSVRPVEAPSPSTALFLLPVAASTMDAAVAAAAMSLPQLVNSGVFLADSAMLGLLKGAQLPALAQCQALPNGSNLTPQCHHLPGLFPAPTGDKSVPIGPDANRGQNLPLGDS